MPRLYLGLDSSTQSLTAIVIEVDGEAARVVLETSLAFDEAFPQYGTRHGVLPDTDLTVVVSSPLLWADALDLMLDRVADFPDPLDPNGYLVSGWAPASQTTWQNLTGAAINVYNVPVIVSAGRNTRMGLHPVTMAETGADANDNIYSYRLREGGGGN